MEKIVTFTTYEQDDVQALTAEEFTSDESFAEWVWHLAPSKEAAIARHQEAMDIYEDDLHFEVFDHSNPPPGWSHAIDLNCLEISTRLKDGSDLTAEQVRHHLREIVDKWSDKALLSMCNIIHTARDL